MRSPRAFASKPKQGIRRDRRGGLHKLKEIIYFLRKNGFNEGDIILYDDVEYAVITISQGLDERTIKKYMHQLLKFGYLKPKGKPIKKVSNVTVTTYSRVDSSPRRNPKSYSSDKGYASYVFGAMAPKQFVETILNAEPIPPIAASSDDNERVREMLVRVGVTSEKCVCDSRGSSTESEESG